MMCYWELGSVRYILMGPEGGVFRSSSADHVTSDISLVLMWSVCVSLETIRLRSKQGDPLPPTDSLLFMLFPSSHHLHYVKICNIIQCESQSMHTNTAYGCIIRSLKTVFIPQNSLVQFFEMFYCEISNK